MPKPYTREEYRQSGKAVAARTLIQAGVVAAVAGAFLLIVNAYEVFLVVFGGILLAVLFSATGKWISQKVRLPEKVGLAIAVAGPVLLFAAFFWLAAPSISDQADQLAVRIPEAIQQLEDRALKYGWVQGLLAKRDQFENLIPGSSKAAGMAARLFSSTFGALGNLVIALAVGIFLAVSPRMYINGVLRLIPPDKRARADEVLVATGSALQSWLAAKIIAMLAIGVLTTLGLWLIGIDLALVLGLIAGILSFIPNIGPIVALIPAALLALVTGIDTVIYVVLLYSGIQTLESYVLTPVLQKRMVDLPPALIVGMQVLLGVLAGALGIIMATPLTAALMVMVKSWYVEDLLGDKE